MLFDAKTKGNDNSDTFVRAHCTNAADCLLQELPLTPPPIEQDVELDPFPKCAFDADEIETIMAVVERLQILPFTERRLTNNADQVEQKDHPLRMEGTTIWAVGESTKNHV